MFNSPDFCQCKLQKLDALVRSLAERSQQLDALVGSHDDTHRAVIQLEQSVCESIAKGGWVGCRAD